MYGASGHGGPSGTDSTAHVHIQFADGAKADIAPDGTVNMNVPRNSPAAQMNYGLPLSPEEQAKATGVDVSKIKRNLFIFSAILTGGAISLSGTIGFIDLIAPHVVRRVFGSKHKYVIPMSFVFGGCLMVISDLIARTVVVPSELPVGAVTALIGAPFFAYIYFKNKR